MTLLAATATPIHAGYAVFVLLIVVVTLGYAAMCWLRPFGRCHRCKGTGDRRTFLGGHVRGGCRRCDGTRHALRIGRRVANHLRELHRNAR